MSMGLILLFLVMQQAPAKPMTSPQSGIWSSQAAYLWPGPTAIADFPAGGRSIEVRSPDGLKRINVNDDDLKLMGANSTKIVGSPIPVSDLAEILWAPDSKAFAITQSNGGWVGTWDVSVCYVESGGLRLVHLSKGALADFNHRKVTKKAPNGCEIQGGNIGAIAWVHGSEDLLLLAEAPPHSSDCDMGYLRGYLVEARTGTVLRRYAARDVGRIFSTDLGSRFH